MYRAGPLSEPPLKITPYKSFLLPRNNSTYHSIGSSLGDENVAKIEVGGVHFETLKELALKDKNMSSKCLFKGLLIYLFLLS
jgi:hypothetical protein